MKFYARGGFGGWITRTHTSSSSGEAKARRSRRLLFNPSFGEKKRTLVRDRKEIRRTLNVPASAKSLFSRRRANSRPRRLWLGDEGKERDDEPPSIERVQKEEKRSRKSSSFFFACSEEEKKGNSSLHDGSRRKKREDVATLPFLPGPIRDVGGGNY